MSSLHNSADWLSSNHGKRTTLQPITLNCFRHGELEEKSIMNFSFPTLSPIKHRLQKIIITCGRKVTRSSPPPSPLLGKKNLQSIMAMQKTRVRQDRQYINPWTLSPATTRIKKTKSSKRSVSKITRSYSPFHFDDVITRHVLLDCDHIFPQPPGPTTLWCSIEAELEEDSYIRLTSSNFISAAPRVFSWKPLSSNRHTVCVPLQNNESQQEDSITTKNR